MTEAAVYIWPAVHGDTREDGGSSRGREKREWVFMSVFMTNYIIRLL